MKSIRLNLGISQQALARRCGMSRQQLQAIENGAVLATVSQAQALERELGIFGLPCSKDRLKSHQIRQNLRLRPYQFETVNPECWLRAIEKWWYFTIRISPHHLAWVQRLIRCDSTTEALAWIMLMTRGARPFLGNPCQWGFRQHGILDSLGQFLGERALPGFYISNKVWLWPQVHIRPQNITYRLDALLLKQKRWFILEVDGDGHNPEKDRFRQAQLGLEEIRITSQEIRRTSFLVKLGIQ